MDINLILDNIHPLSETSRFRILGIMQEVRKPKGHLLIQADKVEPHIYFIKKGIMRAYADTADNEITFWFGKEGDAVISMRSYVENQKGYENIELLEECDLYQLDAQELKNLYEQDIAIANWGRHFAEQELIKTEAMFISRQFRTARERYVELITQDPELLQRVQLSHVASYLGITQVSLSRIRAEIR